MKIERSIDGYIVFAEDTLANALKKISENKRRVVFSVTESGELEGILTDGDFRRWIIAQRSIDVNQPISIASNKHYRFAPYSDDYGAIEKAFDNGFDFIPLLDRRRRLVAVAWRQTAGFQIGAFEISADSLCFVIAEIGNNHNGSVELAYRLVDAAIAAGANCAKFQMRHMSALYLNSRQAGEESEDLGSQYVLDLLGRFQLKDEELLSVFEYCRMRGILAMCTPWDKESLEVLERNGLLAYKVASADLTNHEFLGAVAATRKPILLSTGMSTEQEIIDSIGVLRRTGAEFALLHCNSTYPAPFKDLNLAYLARLKRIGNCPVGYSGHERGIAVAIAAVALGAKIIEKHLTLDRSMEGNDHRISLLPDEFKAMMSGIRETEQAIGSESPRQLSQGELMNREVLAKSLVATSNITQGDVISAGMIDVRSPGKGLAPYRKSELVGRMAHRNINAGAFFYPSDIDGVAAKPRSYQFRRAFGLPVRYHDAMKMKYLSNCDFLEFHLSYRDLDLEFKEYLTEAFDLDLIVHSPELFSGDHILDLCAPDRAYRQRSIAELQRVVDTARALMPLFTRSSRPLVIINAGGFTQDAPLGPLEREPLYELIAESLSHLDSQGVEIVPQTMPPFPWHFGGQRFHNLFVDPDDIAQFCRAHRYRVCLDLAHSKLACNHSGNSLHEFIEKIGFCVAHLHLVDAAGVDGEGLQIGDGEIDFRAAAEVLDRFAPLASFVPEVWQGHKNDGEGFWIALERLESAMAPRS